MLQTRENCLNLPISHLSESLRFVVHFQRKREKNESEKQFSYSASFLSCIPPVLHHTCPGSLYCIVLYIIPFLDHSCPAFFLSLISPVPHTVPPVLHHSCPASILSCIPAVLLPSYPASLPSCIPPRLIVPLSCFPPVCSVPVLSTSLHSFRNSPVCVSFLCA